jgi:hypothetical protein
MFYMKNNKFKMIIISTISKKGRLRSSSNHLKGIFRGLYLIPSIKVNTLVSIPLSQEVREIVVYQSRKTQLYINLVVIKFWKYSKNIKMTLNGFVT